MESQLQTALIALRVAGDTEAFQALVFQHGQGIVEGTLDVLSSVGLGDYAEDASALDTAYRDMQLIEQDTDKAVASALFDASHRLAERAVGIAELHPLDASAVITAVKASERFPEFSERVLAIQQDAVVLAADEVRKWRAHELANLPDSLPALLRVSLDRKLVETSKNQNVPASACERIWRLSYRARQLGRPLTEQEFIEAGGTAVGSYSLTQVEADGTMTVSCHRLSVDELDLIASQLGYTPT